MKRSLQSLLFLALFFGCESTTPTDKQENSGKDKDPDNQDTKEDRESSTGSDETEDDESGGDESGEEGDNDDPSTGPGEEEDDEDEESSSSSGSEEDKSNKENDTSDDSTGDGTDKDPDGDSDESGGSDDKDPCKAIKWGDKVKVGSIVPRGDTPGFWDQDGNGTLDKEETQVGMCELHKTGKKCGVVIFGKEN